MRAAWRRSTARPTAPSRTCRSAASGDSGTGWREAGTEALDVYSDWKTVYVNHDPGAGLVDAVRRRARPGARGSERVPGKNVRALAGHPLIAYSIAAARESGVFDAVVVSTDSEEIAAVARRYGAEVPGLRPAELATATSPDIEWVRHTLDAARAATAARSSCSRSCGPTSPFRGAGDDPARVRRSSSRSATRADSIRAVELCRQHPGKMWVVDGEPDASRCSPQPEGVPSTRASTRRCREVYVQNSSLEIAWTRVARPSGGTIAGERVVARSSPRAPRGSRSTTRTTGERGRATLASARRRCADGWRRRSPMEPSDGAD